MTMPEDFDGGTAEMLRNAGEGYERLKPLAERLTTDIKLNTGKDNDESELWKEFGYSRSIAQLSKMTQKVYGYQRDAAVVEPLGQTAVRGSDTLAEFVFDAPCVNRQARWNEEDRLAAMWNRLANESDAPKDPDSPDVHVLLGRWSKANAFMAEARIFEEMNGIDASVHLYDEYLVHQDARAAVRMEAAKLPPADKQFFDCRTRQYQIMDERSFDLAMGYPIHDFTDLKTRLVDGADVHDLVQEMPWPWKESYSVANGSMMDGVAHRQQLMALNAQQLPQQQQMNPWGMAPPWMMNGPQGQDEDEDDEDGKPDKRKALLGFFGGNKSKEPKPIRRRNRGGRR